MDKPNIREYGVRVRVRVTRAHAAHPCLRANLTNFENWFGTKPYCFCFLNLHGHEFLLLILVSGIILHINNKKNKLWDRLMAGRGLFWV